MHEIHVIIQLPCYYSMYNQSKRPNTRILYTDIIIIIINVSPSINVYRSRYLFI